MFSPGANATPFHMNESDREQDAARYDTGALRVISREGLTCQEVENFFDSAILEGKSEKDWNDGASQSTMGIGKRGFDAMSSIAGTPFTPGGGNRGDGSSIQPPKIIEKRPSTLTELSAAQGDGHNANDATATTQSSTETAEKRDNTGAGAADTKSSGKSGIGASSIADRAQAMSSTVANVSANNAESDNGDGRSRDDADAATITTDADRNLPMPAESGKRGISDSSDGVSVERRNTSKSGTNSNENGSDDAFVRRYFWGTMAAGSLLLGAGCFIMALCLSDTSRGRRRIR
mmetsp:Transcript_4869/g.12790  ORF Transcript_4869/g.12790 Transcript_4869/m.12790 type:complete len:291 (-) Transcript_4869:230-1102(-)